MVSACCRRHFLDEAWGLHLSVDIRTFCKQHFSYTLSVNTKHDNSALLGIQTIPSVQHGLTNNLFLKVDTVPPYKVINVNLDWRSILVHKTRIRKTRPENLPNTPNCGKEVTPPHIKPIKRKVPNTVMLTPHWPIIRLSDTDRQKSPNCPKGFSVPQFPSLIQPIRSYHLCVCYSDVWTFYLSVHLLICWNDPIFPFASIVYMVPHFVALAHLDLKA